MTVFFQCFHHRSKIIMLILWKKKKCLRTTIRTYVSYNNSRGAQSSFLHRVFSPYMYDLKHVCTLRELSGENWMIFGPLLSFKCVHWSLSRGNHNSLSPHVEERSEKIVSLNLSKLKTSRMSDFQRISFL